MSRLIPVAGVILVVVVGLLYWKLSQSEEPARTSTPTPIKSVEPVAMSKVMPPKPSRAQKVEPESATEGEAGKKLKILDEESNEFTYRVEVDIPDKLRAAGASACDLDLTSDDKVHFSYRLVVKDGTVSVADVKVTDSEVNDVTEQCLRNAVETATWKVDDMADFEEDNDLFIRLRAMRKYKTRAEFKRGE